MSENILATSWHLQQEAHQEVPPIGFCPVPEPTLVHKDAKHLPISHTSAKSFLLTQELWMPLMNSTIGGFFKYNLEKNEIKQ